MTFIKYFLKYNFDKIIFLFLVIFSFILYKNSEPYYYDFEVVAKFEYNFKEGGIGTTYYNIDGSKLDRSDINFDLNPRTSFFKGDIIKIESISLEEFWTFIFLCLFIILFVTSFFDSILSFRGFYIEDVKISIFMEKVKFIDGKFIYKDKLIINTIFCTNYPIYINGEEINPRKFSNRNLYKIYQQKKEYDQLKDVLISNIIIKNTDTVDSVDKESIKMAIDNINDIDNNNNNNK